MDNDRSLSPDPLFYHLILPPLRLYLRLRYGFAGKPSPLVPKMGAFMVLGNHASNLDFLFALPTLYPRRPNFLVARHFFGQRALALLLRLLRAIPREQFRPDPASIMAMRRVLKAGGCVALYPEGEVNGTGRFDRMPEGMGRLCALMGVPVYVSVTRGSHLTRPKWAVRERRGRVECTFKPLFSTADLRELSPAALEQRLREALFYDDYAWQSRMRLPFHATAPALGLENMLYLCPRCASLCKMQSRARTLRCTACGNTATMDKYCLLRGGQGDRVFASVADWVEFQRESLRREAAAPDFCLSAEAALYLHLSDDALAGVSVGTGVICLDAEALRYEGTRRGEKVALTWPLTDFYKLSFDVVDNSFTVPGTRPAVSLHPKLPGMAQRFVLGVNVLYDRRMLGEINNE